MATDSTNTPFIEAGQPVRWGIIGTGQIAKIFAADIPYAGNAELKAVGSRNQANADAFGDRFNVPNRYGNYQDLANDPEVDVVYVATPHPAHHDAVIMCLEAGKHVLCEKSFAMNAAEAREMIDAAKKNNRFLMEAMWTRFRPLMYKVREIVSSGEIGEVQFLTANIGWTATFDPEFRLYAPELGGGGLLDAGIYPLSFASMILGKPDQVQSVATLGETNVDENAMIAMHFPSGAVASVGVTIRSSPVSLGMICGTKGTILIDHDWHRPTTFSLRKPGQEPQFFDYTLPEGVGYQFQMNEVERCLREGLTESDVMPLEETLWLVEIMECVLREWGVKYPSDRD
jgi:predicted dehydrogenase